MSAVDDIAAAVDVLDVDEEEKEDEVTDCSNQNVLTKYTTAGTIAQDALRELKKLCVTGAKITDLCTAGDDFVTKRCATIYKQNKKMTKGIAFPTCVSVNNVVGHVSPLDNDGAAGAAVLKDGDLVKLDLSVHVDGYVVSIATTAYVAVPDVAIDAKLANLLKACETAGKLAKSMLKVGGKNTAVTEMFAKVADEFKVKPVQGVLSHNIKRFEIDGVKTILSKADQATHVDEVEFAAHEVYAVDIVMSTGEGLPKESEDRVTVFKRTIDGKHSLKLPASRDLYSKIKEKTPTFPFSLRHLEDQIRAKLGINECKEHNLVSSYPVMLEKAGEYVAQLKFTAVILPTGTVQVAHVAIDQPLIQKADLLVKDEALLTALKECGVAGKKKKKK